MENNILVTDSLAETLWRLEEVRRGFRPQVSTQVTQALNWVLSRQGLKGAYRGLFAPTEKDLKGVKLLTGEAVFSAALRHILGEEALRTVIAWNLESSSTVAKAKENFSNLFEKAGDPPAKTTGFFCCHQCTPAFMRTLTLVKPQGWEVTLEKSLENIRLKRTSDGRWRSFPFYYTLFTLSGIDMPSAKAELRHASTAAKKVIGRYLGQKRIPRFRRIGLKASLDA
ncbi:MAG: hypothetical protein JSV58_02415 [Candidatus Bathyarchaeota archaeon]|nr:MAG: hypothetical protein JSV58_02415 [Candidatus Bathyarchaeota archaeon]